MDATQFCQRCGRPVPSLDSPEYVEWEAADEEGNMICPGCLTREEQDEMDRADMAEMMCVRCGFIPTGEEGEDEEDEAGYEWVVLPEGLLCPSCQAGNPRPLAPER